MKTYGGIKIYLQAFLTSALHGDKGEGKVVPVLKTKHCTMKTYWESGSTAPRILKLCARWR